MIALPQRKTKYAPSELGEKHREMIRMYSMGVELQRIAEAMDCSRHHVRYVVNSPMAMVMRRELEERKDEKACNVMARLAEVAPKALSVMEQALDGELEGVSPALRIKVCEGILDRAGFGRVMKVSSQNLHATLSAEDIMRLRQRATREAAAI